MKIAFVHPDLGIGGAERLVVDAALGLQNQGHEVVIYTSYHDPKHSFDETRNGTLNVQAHDPSPFIPRSILKKGHILMAHLRQIHLTLWHILPAVSYSTPDVFFVDQLSTCVPLLRWLGAKRVVFYCHFPDFLLADGEFKEGQQRRKRSLLKRIYRFPMDRWEEWSTGQADTILVNSGFTSNKPKVVWPGINIGIYEEAVDWSDADVVPLHSDRPTLLSINRFEKKKNVALAVSAYAVVRKDHSTLRLVLAGGYDPRLEDNNTSSVDLPQLKTTQANPDVLFVLNFSTSQRTALLRSPSTKCLLYTPTNEHFGIGPVEGMICSLPVLACASARTGWLCSPEVDQWAAALQEILALSEEERRQVGERGRARAKAHFSMEGMTNSIEQAVKETAERGKVRDWDFEWVFRILLIIAAVAAIYYGKRV
ncbi:alpha-1,3-mannosyltransferase ALG2 [Flagelloscypha sp. PMI_526]|nr:alpha-1,3-mannosyltransferase ALG2 [Flagelloscypha sp. PMI_526]